MVFVGAGQRDDEIDRRKRRDEIPAPFDQRDGTSAHGLVDPQLVHVPRGREAIQIGVQRGRGRRVLRDERERRTRDGLVVGPTESAQHAPHQRRLASAERAFEEDDLAPAEERGERSPEGFGGLFPNERRAHARTIPRPPDDVDGEPSGAHHRPVPRPSPEARVLRIGPLAALAIAVALPSPAPARGDAPPAPLHAITLDGRYAPEARTFTGRIRIAFRNTSRVPLESLVFHRYLEAFRDERSVFHVESRGRLRGVPLTGRGGTALDHVRVNGIEVTSRLDRELVPEDFTQFRVPLPSPLPPGGVVDVEVEFRSHLPDLAARAGTHGRFHMLAQFFPKPARLADDGTFTSFPYHGNGEFFADFARYDVTIRAPVGYAVEGTGERISDEVRGTERIHHFVASPVHDAAYAIASGYEVRVRRCAGVALRTMSPPGYGLAAEHHTRATCFGLGYFGSRLGAYPYRTLTVIVPPRGAEGGAGMEYPTAFVTDGSWGVPEATRFPLALETTFHELGHQWFQGIVATDEVSDPVLDEGLTNFLGIDAASEYAGDVSRVTFDFLRVLGTDRALGPPAKPAHAFSAYDYGASVYVRSALVLETFARTHGRARLYAALGRYAREQAFRHPVLADLERAFEAEFGGEGRAALHAALVEGALADHSPGAIPDRSGSRAVAQASGPLATLSPATRRDHDGCLRANAERTSLLDPDFLDDLRCSGRNFAAVPTLGGAIALILRWIGP